MNGRIVTNEFAKMRGLHAWPLIGGLFGLTLAVLLYSTLPDPSFQPGTEQAWNLALNGIAQGSLVASPLLLAVLASRQIDIEHTGNGWLMSATSGAVPGALARAKFVALGIIVVGAAVLVSAFGLVFGMLTIGGTVPVPWGRWIGVSIAVLVVNLVLLAIHIVLAARVENQLVGIGVGLLGLIFALVASGMPDWADHVLPWGYYTLVMPAEYQGTTLVQAPPDYVGVAVLGGIAAVLFTLFTGRFDRTEV